MGFDWKQEWLAVKHGLLGYPPGHRWYQAHPVLRYYPLAMTLLVVGSVAYVAYLLLVM